MRHCHRLTRLLCLLVLCLPVAHASQWRQGWGLGNAGTAAATVAEGVRLTLQQQAGTVAVWAEYDSPGPLQVRLHGGADAGLPLERELPAPGRYLLTTLPLGQPQQLRLDAVPGPVRSTALRPSVALPLDAATPVRIHQAAHGQASHHDRQNRHAWDFALAEGTPVLAAAAGRVIGLHAASTGPSRIPGDGGNWIRLLHADGSMSVYAHLQPGSLRVALGQSVRAGQLLAASGNTGFSTAPHLHFVVQVNAGMALASIPAQVNGPYGQLHAAGTPGPAPL